MDWVLSRVVDQSHRTASVDNTMIINFIFADDAVMVADNGGSGDIAENMVMNLKK